MTKNKHELSNKMRKVGWLISIHPNFVYVKDPVLGFEYKFDKKTNSWDIDPTVMVDLHLAISNIDWYYEMSDDSRVYKRGEAHIERIKKTAERCALGMYNLVKIEAKYTPCKHSYFK